MTLGKHKTRPITVEGRRFRWRCDFNHPDLMLSEMAFNYRLNNFPDRLLVRPDDAPHRLLTVSWPPCHAPLVKSCLVRACTEEALRQGWLAEHSVMELAGFLVPISQDGQA